MFEIKTEEVKYTIIDFILTILILIGLTVATWFVMAIVLFFGTVK